MEEAGPAAGRLARRRARLEWGGGGWWGPALAAGALLAAPYYGYGYGGSCTAYSPMYDAYGNYIGEQLVNVC